MKAIIGLGNPEVKYAHTRHNTGFMVLDELLRRKNLTLTEKFKGFFAKSGDVLFLMPSTYMNLSGDAVIALSNFYKLSNKDILIVFDDVSMDLGRMRFRSEGSDGGHNGIKSIINNLGTNVFDRLKVGIGPKDPRIPLNDHVLGNFRADEDELLSKTIKKAADAVEMYILSGIKEAQNKFNS